MSDEFSINRGVRQGDPLSPKLLTAVMEEVCTLIWCLGFMSCLFCVLTACDWMFQHNCWDASCFECLICMCFVFLYLPLFSAIEHVSRNTLTTATTTTTTTTAAAAATATTTTTFAATLRQTS